MLDQALDTAEALGERPHRRLRDELDRLLFRLHLERDHAAEVAHLTGRDLVARVVGQPGPEDLRDPRVGAEELHDAARVRALPIHAHGERLHAAKHQPGVERARNRPERLLQEPQPFGDRRVVRAGEAADDVRVAPEVLRRGVDDDVRAEVERVLEVRRRERRVDDEQGAGGARRGCDGRDVDEVEQRVGRRLDPDEPRVAERAPPGRPRARRGSRR